MSEHTPLTEAERIECAVDWLEKFREYADDLLADLRLAARTSTATADTACPRCEHPAHGDRCRTVAIDGGPCVCEHAATADTGLRERVEALLVPEPEPAMVPDAPDLYWRRLGSPSEHATKGPHASWCVICQETCSRGLACRCCWPPVDQDDLRDALATPASTEDRADNEGTR